MNEKHLGDLQGSVFRSTRWQKRRMNHIEQWGIIPPRRKLMRSDVQILAYVQVPGGSQRPIHVTDLSCAGFQMVSYVTMPIDRWLVLSLPGLTAVTFQIAWFDDIHYGCVFKHQLHEEFIAHIVVNNPSIFRAKSTSDLP